MQRYGVFLAAAIPRIRYFLRKQSPLLVIFSTAPMFISGGAKKKRGRPIAFVSSSLGGADGTRTRDPLRDRQVF